MAGNFRNNSERANSRLPSTTSTEETGRSERDSIVHKQHPSNFEGFTDGHSGPSAEKDVGRLGPMGKSG